MSDPSSTSSQLIYDLQMYEDFQKITVILIPSPHSIAPKVTIIGFASTPEYTFIHLIMHNKLGISRDWGNPPDLYSTDINSRLHLLDLIEKLCS